ncbi:TPA: hypothetical protein ACPVW7_000069 [Vibrio parahaemolyticus]
MQIPTYILEALKFSLSGRNLEDIWWKMLNHNIEDLKEEDKAIFEHVPDLQDCLKIYSGMMDDSFSRFVKLYAL